MVKIRVNEIDINPPANAEAGQASNASTTEQRRNFPGQMQILAFSALKDEMGDDWDQSKHRVHATVEKILTTELGPWDFSTLIGQDNYLIIYGEDNINAAELTSRQIGKKVGAGFGGKIRSRLMDVRPQGDRLHRTIIEETEPAPTTSGKTSPTPEAHLSPIQRCLPRRWTTHSQKRTGAIIPEPDLFPFGMPVVKFCQAMQFYPIGKSAKANCWRDTICWAKTRRLRTFSTWTCICLTQSGRSAPSFFKMTLQAYSYLNYIMTRSQLLRDEAPFTDWLKKRQAFSDNF